MHRELPSEVEDRPRVERRAQRRESISRATMSPTPSLRPGSPLPRCGAAQTRRGRQGSPEPPPGARPAARQPDVGYLGHERPSVIFAQVGQNDAPSTILVARHQKEPAAHGTDPSHGRPRRRRHPSVALLLKARATELSELRRFQTQLSVYGDRRANMESEPAAIEARIAVLTRLIDQMMLGGGR